MNLMWQERSLEQEQLDDLTHQGKELAQILTQLAHINRWLGAHRAILSGLKELDQKGLLPRNRPLQIVDLGCGGGDLLRQVAQWGMSHNYELAMLGIDGNHQSIAIARKRSEHLPQIKFDVQNLSQGVRLPAEVDLIVSSHYLYHFPDAELTQFLQDLLVKVNIAILATDLMRHPLPYYLFKLLNRLLPTHPTVKQDGLLAIRRALRKAEWEKVIAPLNASNSQIRPFWAFRYQLLIQI